MIAAPGRVSPVTARGCSISSLRRAMYPCFMCVKIYNTIGGLQAHTLLEHRHDNQED